jgi:hypothetical protein
VGDRRVVTGCRTASAETKELTMVDLKLEVLVVDEDRDRPSWYANHLAEAAGLGS